MRKLLQSALLIFIINQPLQAQSGTSIIGSSSIGIDSLNFPAIGKASTQNCLFPGPCNSACAVYTFTGAGNWNIEGNWEGNVMPLIDSRECLQIVIDPAGTAECLLNIPFQIISPGINITVMPGKKFRIPGNLVNN